MHYSAVRRYFTSHKEVLLHLAAEGWVRWSDTVCEDLRDAGPVSPARVAKALADGLAADPLFCDLLANLHLHLEHEVEIDRVLEFKRISNAAVVSLADTIENALPGLGRSGAFDVLLASYSLAAPMWQIANPPKKLADAYAKETDVPPDWKIDFTAALTRLITATCVGLMTEPGSQITAERAARGCGYQFHTDMSLARIVLAVLGFLGDDALVVEEDLHVVGPGQRQRIDLGCIKVSGISPAVRWRQRVKPVRLVLGGLIYVRVIVVVSHVPLVINRLEIPCGGQQSARRCRSSRSSSEVSGSPRWNRWMSSQRTA